jgi:hypothetical protein
MLYLLREDVIMDAIFGLVGNKIKGIRWMTDEEKASQGWDDSPHPGVVLDMEGGGKIFAAADKEGNGPGAFFGTTPEGENIYVEPDKPFEPLPFKPGFQKA